MSNDFNEIMAGQSDKGLVKILTYERDQFQPAALLAAETELKKRNLTVESFDDISNEIDLEIKQDKEKANQPLGIFWKLLAFLLPGLITLAFSGSFKAEGYDRKAKELLRWTLYGFGFYAVLITIVMTINPLVD